MNSTLMILWKTLHFGHISAHMYKVCACAWAHANTNSVGSLLYRLQQRYLFRIALWHMAVCVYVCGACTQVHTNVLYKSSEWFRTKKIHVNEKSSPLKTISNGILLFYKKHGLRFVFPLVYINLWMFPFYFYSVKTLKIFIQMGELGFFCNLKWCNRFH